MSTERCGVQEHPRFTQCTLPRESESTPVSAASYSGRGSPRPGPRTASMGPPGCGPLAVGVHGPGACDSAVRAILEHARTHARTHAQATGEVGAGRVDSCQSRAEPGVLAAQGRACRPGGLRRGSLLSRVPWSCNRLSAQAPPIPAGPPQPSPAHLAHLSGSGAGVLGHDHRLAPWPDVSPASTHARPQPRGHQRREAC